MRGGFLLSILSYKLSYESVYAQLVFHAALLLLLKNDTYIQSEGTRSKSLDKTSDRNLNNIYVSSLYFLTSLYVFIT